MSRVRLSVSEIDALMHRLEVPDAIGEYMEDSFDFNPDEICQAIQNLEKKVSAGSVWIESEVEREVLADLVEGATWVACAVDNVTPQEMRKIVRVAKSLEKKIGQVVGRSLCFPLR